MSKMSSLPWLLAALVAFTGIGPALAQKPPTPTAPASQFPVVPTPPAADAAAGEAVTKPFQPAVRVPRPLPVNPLAAVSTLTNLVFDAEVKEQKGAPDQFDFKFTFAVTNVSTENVVINAVRTSCGCTVAQVPNLPWTLAPGTHGEFGINMDMRGKSGSVTKSVFVATEKHGNKTIYVRSILADPATMTDDQRKKNLLIAKADRQAVFKGECAACHAVPAFGKTGTQLYDAACGVCHEGAHRNEMVPDLNIARQVRDQDYWRKWIAEGKEGTLMPAFAQKQGGPLTDAQILSLAHLLTLKFPNPQNFPGNQPKLDAETTR